MKVLELIEHLQRLPPDDDVVIKVQTPHAQLHKFGWVGLTPPYRQNDHRALQVVLVPSKPLQQS